MHPRRPALAALAVATLLAAAPQGAQAHKPSYSTGAEYGSIESAYVVQNIETSIVVYHEVTCEAPLLWMRFEVGAMQDLFVQIGVPVIDRLADYRPSFAIVAPGLDPPDEPVPFEVPEGMGALVVHTDDGSEPGEFYEPFTQTESWVVHESTRSLPQPGVGFIVAWPSDGMSGKLWVAVGTVEDFNAEDFENAEMWFESTQTFHETGDYAPDVVPEEVQCELPWPPEEGSDGEAGADGEAGTDGEAAPDAPPSPTAGAPDDGSCSGAPEAPLGGLLPWLAAALAVLAWRRRDARGRA